MAITVGTYAGKPGSPSSGDLHFPTDSFYNVLYYNGSAWEHFKHGKQLTTPPSFSWVNQGTASIVTANGGEAMIAPSAGASHQCRLRVKSAPSPPYKLTAAFLPALTGTSYNYFGLAFRESSSGKLVTLMPCFDASARVMVHTWNAPTSPASLLAQFELSVLVSSPLIFWRIEDDNTDRKYSFSADGINFVQFYSEGRTSFLTGDELAWFVNPYNQNADVTLLHWLEA